MKKWLENIAYYFSSCIQETQTAASFFAVAKHVLVERISYALELCRNNPNISFWLILYGHDFIETNMSKTFVKIKHFPFQVDL